MIGREFGDSHNRYTSVENMKYTKKDVPSKMISETEE